MTNKFMTDPIRILVKRLVFTFKVFNDTEISLEDRKQECSLQQNEFTI